MNYLTKHKTTAKHTIFFYLVVTATHEYETVKQPLSVGTGTGTVEETLTSSYIIEAVVIVVLYVLSVV